MKTMTLEEFTLADPQPPPPKPAPTTPVRPCFCMYEGGVQRTRPGPTMLTRNGALEEVAHAFDGPERGPLTPDEIVEATKLPPAGVDVALSFLLFISAITRDASDAYRANCPCVAGEALSRLQALQDLEDTDDPEFGAVAADAPPLPPRPPQARSAQPPAAKPRPPRLAE